MKHLLLNTTGGVTTVTLNRPEMRNAFNDEVITEILARATADRPAYPPGWSRRVFWSLLLSGYSAVRDDGIPRHQVVDAIMNSLTQGTITSA